MYSYAENRHIEGGRFHHRVSSPEQAVLSHFCFSTVHPGGGGTLLVERSHRLAAQILWGLSPMVSKPILTNPSALFSTVRAGQAWSK